MTAGYPNRDDTVPLLLALQAGGADVVELGVPFTDPQADGTTIQRASEVCTSYLTLYAYPNPSSIFGKKEATCRQHVKSK